jgi:hypothetical protein
VLLGPNKNENILKGHFLTGTTLGAISFAHCAFVSMAAEANYFDRTEFFFLAVSEKLQSQARINRKATEE